MMHNLTLEQIGIDLDVLAKFLSLSERPERVFKHFDMDKILKHLDTAKVLKHLDTDVLLDDLMKRLGPDKVREWVDQHTKPPSNPAGEQHEI